MNSGQDYRINSNINVFDCEDENDNADDLQTLLSQTPIQDWEPIFQRVLRHPEEARRRYYRKQSPLQLALLVRERKKKKKRNGDFSAHTPGTSSSFSSSTATRSCYHRGNCCNVCRESRCRRSESDGNIQRLDVLKAIVTADPPSIQSLDSESRTPLHTACSEGRSWEILNWLIEAESCFTCSHRKIADLETNGGKELRTLRNAASRTYWGALPLHSISGCQSFEDCLGVSLFTDFSESCKSSEEVIHGNCCVEPRLQCNVTGCSYCNNHPGCLCVHCVLSPLFNRIQCKLSPNTMASYAATSTVQRAYPEAVWERDNEFEIPLHSAASWGQVGSVVALLMGAAAADRADNIFKNGPADVHYEKFSSSKLEQGTVGQRSSSIEKVIIAPSNSKIPCVTSSSSTALAEAAAKASRTLDKSKNSPLDRACQRVCAMCVHGIGSVVNSPKCRATSSFSNSPTVATASTSTDGSDKRTPNTSQGYRVSTTREDPFEGFRRTGSSANQVTSENQGAREIPGGAIFSSINANTQSRRSLLSKSLTGSSRRRIPGCGSSFRSSFSNSFVGLDADDDEGNRVPIGNPLRASFVSRRRPVDPICGLENLDEDGKEEFAKVEILAMAAMGAFLPHSMMSASRPMDIGQPLDKGTIGRDQKCFDFGTEGVFLLVHSLIYLGCSPEVVWHSAAKYPQQVGVKGFKWGTPLSIACENLMLSCNTRRTSLLETKWGVPKVVQQVGALSNTQQLTETLELTEKSHFHEVIRMLLYSPLFGRPEMASVENENGQLPLHLAVASGALFVNQTESSETLMSSDIEDMDDQCPSDNFCLIRTLLDACPHALEARDAKSQLYPFMMAATIEDSLTQPANNFSVEGDEGSGSGLDTECICLFCVERDSGKSLEKECTKRLETIYRLLLEAPVVISFCLQKFPKEK